MSLTHWYGCLYYEFCQTNPTFMDEIYNFVEKKTKGGRYVCIDAYSPLVKRLTDFIWVNRDRFSSNEEKIEAFIYISERAMEHEEKVYWGVDDIHKHVKGRMWRYRKRLF